MLSVCLYCACRENWLYSSLPCILKPCKFTKNYKIIKCNCIMVSKIVLTFFVGQILLAILFFYLLPISSASKYQKSTVKIEKSNKPIINLKQGKNNFLQSIIFSYYIHPCKKNYIMYWNFDLKS